MGDEKTEVNRPGEKRETVSICGARHIRTYQRGVFYSALNSHNSLHLATAYWKFCTLCIWSLTKLLQTRLKSPFSYIYRAYNYLDTCHPSLPKFELLKLVWPGRWKKVSKTCQTALRESSITRGFRVFTFFHFSCSTEYRQSPFCLLKWHIFL